MLKVDFSLVSSGSGLLLMYPIFMTSDVIDTNIFYRYKLFLLNNLCSVHNKTNSLTDQILD